jgi:hypothetical protein
LEAVQLSLLSAVVAVVEAEQTDRLVVEADIFHHLLHLLALILLW